MAVVHVPVRRQADDYGEHAAEQHGDGRTAVGDAHLVTDLQRVAPDRPGDEWRRREDTDQRELDGVLDEREGAPPHLVGNLEAQQGVSGHPGDARERADDEREQRDEHDVLENGDEYEGAADADDRQREPAAAAQPDEQAWRDEHAERQPGEHRADQQPVARVAGTEIGDVRPREADHDPAGGECADDPADEASDGPVGADVLPALDEGAPHPGHLAVGALGPLRKAADPRDRETRDEEGHRVEPERQRQRVGRHVRDDAWQQREPSEGRGRDRRRAVRAEEVQLVGRLEPLPRHEVRDHRLLRGDPEQACALDEDGGDEHPPQLSDERDGQGQTGSHHIPADHGPAAIEAVRDHARERA